MLYQMSYKDSSVEPWLTSGLHESKINVFSASNYGDLQKGLLQPHMIVAFFESFTLTFMMYLLCIPERALDPERKRNLLLYQLS